MPSPTCPGHSRSLRVYARLLELYPPSFLRQHRAELLQNFADLEAVSPSRARLWLMMGKDLAMSVISQFFRSRLGHYVIGVIVVWLLVFVVGYFTHGPTLGRQLLHVFAGFMLGMLAMYIAVRVYGMP